MIFCIAPLAITYALVVTQPDKPDMAMSCFSDQAYCEMAEMDVNGAFSLDSSKNKAHCEQQPAGDINSGNLLTPFGQTTKLEK